MSDENSKNPGDTLPKDLTNFKPKRLENNKTKKDYNTDLLKIRNDDYRWKLNNRALFGYSIMCLLFVQHFLVIKCLLDAYHESRLYEIRWFMSFIVVSLMAETFCCVKYLIKWLFTDISYKI